MQPPPAAICRNLPHVVSRHLPRVCEKAKMVNTMGSKRAKITIPPAKKLVPTKLLPWLIEQIHPYWRIKATAKAFSEKIGKRMDGPPKPRVPWSIIERLCTEEKPRKRVYFEELAAALNELLVHDPDYRKRINERIHLKEIKLEDIGSPVTGTVGVGGVDSKGSHQRIDANSRTSPKGGEVKTERRVRFNVPDPGPHCQSRIEMFDARDSIEIKISLHENVRMVFIGAPRSGKRTIARKLAWEFKEIFPEGALEVSLCGVDGKPVPPSDVLIRIIEQFGRDAETSSLDEAELAEAVARLLKKHRALLILTAAQSVEQIMFFASCIPCSAMFTTSKYNFDTTLISLGYVPLKVHSSSSEASNQLASSLFGGQPVLEEAIASMCDRFQHYLWAVDEAASLLIKDVGATVQEIAHRLNTCDLELLARSKKQFDARYASLQPQARRLWRSLSVFHSTFDADGAIAIVGDVPALAQKTKTLLAQLFDLELLGYFPQRQVFQIPPHHRLFLESTTSAKERSEIQSRHARLMVALVSQYRKVEKDRASALEIKALMASIHGDDLVAAIEWGLKHDQSLSLGLFELGYSFLTAEQAKSVGELILRCAVENRNAYMSAVCFFVIASAMTALKRDSQAIRPFWENGYSTLPRTVSDEKSRTLFFQLQFGLYTCLLACGLQADADDIMKDVRPGDTAPVRRNMRNSDLLGPYHSHPGANRIRSGFRSVHWLHSDYSRW